MINCQRLGLFNGALVTCLMLGMIECSPAQPPRDSRYDYHRPIRLTVMAGIQALMICNGLFVSERSIEQIYAQELKFRRNLVLPPEMVTIDRDRRAVVVGTGENDPFPVMRAAYRPGLGCIVMGPAQTLDDIDALPILQMPPRPDDSAEIPWPDGDLIAATQVPSDTDRVALNAAGEFAFNREVYGHPSQITLSLLIVHEDQIIYERYATGADMTTKTRTWSAAKSIASTLIGIAVGQGKLALDEPLPFANWGTGTSDEPSSGDPRRSITLRHVLNMSSGLYPVDNEMCEVIGSCLGYFAGTSSVQGALNRGLVRPPGTYWDYENYDTLLAVYALKTAIGDDAEYREFPRRALFDRIGMRNTIAGVDRFGDFVLSSQVYSNARDLARLGLLYLNKGRWHGQQILPEYWVEFVTTPAPSTLSRGGMYGGQWWLAPDGAPEVPREAFAMSGGRGQHVVVVPSHQLVIVRRGLDQLPREHRNSPWDLTREVLKAFGTAPAGMKSTATSTSGTRHLQ
jgi:CubicO group peptidase (beta-lactamase class C family)